MRLPWDLPFPIPLNPGSDLRNVIVPMMNHVHVSPFIEDTKWDKTTAAIDF